MSFKELFGYYEVKKIGNSNFIHITFWLKPYIQGIGGLGINTRLS